jgi:RNA polymerase sigma factor (sigma-70 family)
VTAKERQPARIDRQTGDGLDFDALYREHAQRAFRACLRFAAGDVDWAKDRAQEALIKLARHPEVWDDPGLGGWVYRVAVNECLMQLRRERSFGALLGRVKSAVLGGGQADLERGVRARRDVSALELAVAVLPLKERALFTLVYFDGKSQGEAAELVGVSPGQASKLMRRALATLREAAWELAEELE